jgi:hypothetical protein
MKVCRILVYGDFCGRADIFSPVLLGGVTEIITALFGEAAQALHDRRILLGDVVRLADIIFQIKERQADVPPDHLARFPA